ncbi:MAG: Re/Si-specific NAD(P)(+) transhydrogenase subunit alpha [Planctomycetota bacterium]
MIVGVVKETFPGERRVALVPASCPALTKAKFEVLIESGAGVAAGFPDAQYASQGAQVLPRREQVFERADVLVQVRSLGANLDAGASDLAFLRSEHTVIGLSDPLGEPAAAQRLAQTGAQCYSMELIPRITRAQSMDALSSMATIAGYKAVLMAAMELPRIFPMLMTAAGTLAPARVFVVGVGVAGLQAIATARRLGAVVHAYDVRPAVKEQVQSVGATFVELPLETAGAEGKGGYARAQDEDFYRRQRELMTQVVGESQVVITTAAIPGRKSPILVTKEMVAAMAPGSVIVDLAAERGGNCELTQPGLAIDVNGVRILGPLNIASTIPAHASQMYAKNITTLLLYLAKSGSLTPNLEDEVVSSTLVARGGEVVHPTIREKLGLSTNNATIGSQG